MNFFKYKKAVSMGSQTLVGVIPKEFPLEFGNCFGLCTKKQEYNIVNFYTENFDHLIEEGIIEYPVRIKVLDKSCAILCDKRIPDNYYRKDICSICAPYKFWTKEQKAKRKEEINSGKLEVRSFKASPEPLGYIVTDFTEITFGSDIVKEWSEK